MQRYLFLVLALISFSASANEERTHQIEGVWQSSFGYLGKVPYFNGYLIITGDTVTEETEGDINYQYQYERKLSERDFFILQILDSDLKGMYVRINPNSKFMCKPKSRLSYDKECNSLDSDNVFSYCIYETLGKAVNEEGKCKMKNNYYTFKDSQIKNIKRLSESL
tara:strand:- start:1244 stop:1741 length:498 start_codon:yes stop_codon:yes gene_type:complete